MAYSAPPQSTGPTSRGRQLLRTADLGGHRCAGKQKTRHGLFLWDRLWYRVPARSMDIIYIKDLAGNSNGRNEINTAELDAHNPKLRQRLTSRTWPFSSSDLSASPFDFGSLANTCVSEKRCSKATRARRNARVRKARKVVRVDRKREQAAFQILHQMAFFYYLFRNDDGTCYGKWKPVWIFD
jgi:hypothetical protein